LEKGRRISLADFRPRRAAASRKGNRGWGRTALGICRRRSKQKRIRYYRLNLSLAYAPTR
jgi:hypothetical protein